MLHLILHPNFQEELIHDSSHCFHNRSSSSRRNRSIDFYWKSHSSFSYAQTDEYTKGSRKKKYEKRGIGLRCVQYRRRMEQNMNENSRRNIGMYIHRSPLLLFNQTKHLRSFVFSYGSNCTWVRVVRPKFILSRFVPPMMVTTATLMLSPLRLKHLYLSFLLFMKIFRNGAT